MRTIIKISIVLTLLFSCFSKPAFSQFRVENDGSIYTDSYSGNYGRANWTQVHYQYSCAYHLANTYYNGDVFYVRGDGEVWTRNGFLIASDSIFKTNIQNINSPLSKIKNLRGVTYNRKYDTYIPSEDTTISKSPGHSQKVKVQKLEPTEFGLIAQEVEEIIPEVVQTMNDSTKAISYTSLIPLLIEAIKEQQKQIETLQNVVTENEQGIIELEKCCENKNAFLKSASISINSNDNTSDSAKLYQNIPNPFTNKTEIKYCIPIGYINAKIYIHDLLGNEIKYYILRNSGTNSVIINGSELNPGLYVYTLVVNDSIIDSKRMILTKE